MARRGVRVSFMIIDGKDGEEIPMTWTICSSSGERADAPCVTAADGRIAVMPGGQLPVCDVRGRTCEQDAFLTLAA